MEEGEFLFKDGTPANFIYFLFEGKLRVEKEVLVQSVNYWPKERSSWCERMIQNKVLYKIRDIEPLRVIGEKEVAYDKPWPVQIVGAAHTTVLL